MPEPLFNVDELLAEIPGDNPAGENLRYVLVDDGGDKVPIVDVLKDARTERNPDDYDASDPTRPTEVKSADWPKILRLSDRALRESSKHVELAVRITEAAANLNGFAGLADGLALLHGMASTCWDRMHPVVEDGDAEARAGAFNSLSVESKNMNLPHTLRNLPIVPGGGKAIGYNAWKYSQDGKGGVTKEAFDRAVAAAPREACQATYDALTRCQESFLGLTKELNDRMGPDSPAMIEFRTSLGECFTLAKQILQQKGPAADRTGEDAADPEADGTPDGEAGGGGGGGGRLDGQAVASRAVATRADVYRRLQESADLLERLEPHSPIPYLIRRAVDLGAMPFPQLMKAILHDTDLTTMNRELGIKDPPAEESSY